MSDSFHLLPIADINFQDHRFLIDQTEPDIESAAHRIRIAGVTTPPVVAPVKASSGNTLAIISGRTCLMALLRLGKESAHVIQTDVNVLEQDNLVRAIVCVSSKRPLSQAEIIRAVGLLSRLVSTDKIRELSPAIFGQRMNHAYLDQLIRLGRMGETIIHLLRNGRLTIKGAFRTLQFPDSERNTVLSLFERINVSANRQIQIMTFLQEISKREKINLSELLDILELKQILADDNLDDRTKAERIFKKIYERRYPALSSHQNRLKSKIQSLKLSPGIRLNMPENMDSNTFNISFSAKSVKEFENRSNELASLSGHPSLQDIFGP